MGFTEEFSLTGGKSYNELSSEARALIRTEKQLDSLPGVLRQELRRHAESVTAGQTNSAEMITRATEHFAETMAERVRDSMARNTDAVVELDQHMCEYLGWGFSKTHWLLERQTRIGKDILNALLNTLDGQSKQYLQQGIQCFEAEENGLAKERFEKALDSNRTNFFAYQYLGFIAVSAPAPAEAIKNFELAYKFASNDYYRARALKHLARCHWVQRNLDAALECIKTAVNLQPESARLHYDHSLILAAVGKSCQSEAVHALRRAITLDPNYWVIAAVEDGFASIRAAVEQLLNDMMAEAEAKARKVLSVFREMLTKATNLGCGAAIAEFEVCYQKQTNHLQQATFLEILAVPDQVRKCMSECRDVVSKFIQAQINYKASQLDSVRSKKSGERAPALRRLDDLKSKVWSLERGQASMELWKYGKGGCFIILLVYLGIVFMLVYVIAWIDTKLLGISDPVSQERYAKSDRLWHIVVASYAISLPLAAFAPQIMNVFRKCVKYKVPIGRLKRQICKREREASEQADEIDRDFAPGLETIQSERRAIEEKLRLWLKN